jgi:thymidylate synthase ThyX
LSGMSKEAKLAELRAKTDVELIRHVTHELDLGVRFAAYADYESRHRAEEAYAETSRLLPIVHDLGESERRQLEAKVNRLRMMLDHLSALARTAV